MSIFWLPPVKLETALTRFPSNSGNSIFTIATAKALKLANSKSHMSGHKKFQNSLKSNFGCDLSPSLSFFFERCDDDLWLNFKPQCAWEIFDLTTKAPTAKSPVYLRIRQRLEKEFAFCSKNVQMCKVLHLHVAPMFFTVLFVRILKLCCSLRVVGL